jgi:methylene-fatty-acyl-phospholipid synthase
MLASDLSLAFAITVPYIAYSIAYLAPSTFKRFASQDGLVKMSSVLKAVAMTLYLREVLHSGLNIAGLLFGIPLFAVGQLLNVVVYQRLGKERAYYGWELSIRSDPMLVGFPFDIGHAQYKGLILSLLGAFFTANPSVRLTSFTTLWIAMYFYITFVETCKSGRKEA